MRIPCGAPTTGAQVPSAPATSQASHWRVHATLQQWPSAHHPVAHWLGAVQSAPGSAFALQMPDSQYALEAQSVSSAQLAVHAAERHWKGPQSLAGPGPQLPAPSHTLARMELPSQALGPHSTPGSAKERQAPAPSHSPSALQLEG